MEFSGQYLTYEDYMALGGTLDIMPFNLLEFNARKEIDRRTLGRLLKVEEIPQEVKLCIFTMIDSINGYSTNLQGSRDKNIASEHIDGYTVSYVTSGQIQEIINSKSSELEDIMETYLSTTIVNGTPLLYLGVC